MERGQGDQQLFGGRTGEPDRKTPTGTLGILRWCRASSVPGCTLTWRRLFDRTLDDR